MANSAVFNFRRNAGSDWICLTEVGREFQARDAAAGNARSLRKNWFLNLLTWAIGTFLFECYMKILTNTYIDNHTDNRIFSFALCYLRFFLIFTLLIVSDAYSIRWINEYVCAYVVARQGLASSRWRTWSWMTLRRPEVLAKKRSWCERHVSFCPPSPRCLSWPTASLSSSWSRLKIR